MDNLKLKNYQIKQVKSGNFVIEPNALDHYSCSLQTLVLQEYPNSDQPLINYSGKLNKISLIKHKLSLITIFS